MSYFISSAIRKLAKSLLAAQNISTKYQMTVPFGLIFNESFKESVKNVEEANGNLLNISFLMKSLGFKFITKNEAYKSKNGNGYSYIWSDEDAEFDVKINFINFNTQDGKPFIWLVESVDVYDKKFQVIKQIKRYVLSEDAEKLKGTIDKQIQEYVNVLKELKNDLSKNLKKYHSTLLEKQSQLEGIE